MNQFCAERWDTPRPRHYHVLRELARGSYTVLYEAVPTDPSLADRPVALKVLRSPEYARWFLRIAEVAAFLDHAGIVPIYEVGEAEGQPYMAFAFVPGGDLARQIGYGDPWPVEKVVRVVSEAAAALAYAHGRGIIHGHLHPKHILLGEGGSARLIGFGEYPPEGAVFGNPRHLAPEQLQSAGPLTPRTDVYALAETAYWVLGRTHPYCAETVMAMLAMKSSGPPVSIRQMRPDVSPALDAVLRRGMATRPEDRFGSMTEFAEALAVATGRRRGDKKWWKFWK